MPVNSKIVGILLLFCLVAPAAATYTFLQCQKSRIKHAVKQRMIAGIDKDLLILWQFSLADARTELDWEHEREFEYQGQMYDVVETVVYGDSIALWCWPDREESALNKQLDELLQYATDNHPANKAQQKQLVRFLESLFYEELTAWRLSADPAIVILSSGQERFFSSIHFPPPAPPPQSA